MWTGNSNSRILRYWNPRGKDIEWVRIFRDATLSSAFEGEAI
jgi:hypothetical protein